RLKKVRSAGQFVPPSLEGTVVFPGFDGGGEWGGGAFDPQTGLFYINSNEMAWILRLVERPSAKDRPSGRSLYLSHCANCHGKDLHGNPPEFPSLVDIGEKYASSEIATVVRQGSGRMPAFAPLQGPAIRAIVRFLVAGEDIDVAAAPDIGL